MGAMWLAGEEPVLANQVRFLSLRLSALEAIVPANRKSEKLPDVSLRRLVCTMRS
jgi:hypothetical protein